MLSTRSAPVVLIAALAASGGCGTTPTTTPPVTTPPTTQAPALPPPTTLPAPTPPPPGRNQPPVGTFRFMPPVGFDNDIHIEVGDIVRVNAAGFTDPNGDPLILTVHWGDGKSDHIKCGQCRLQHAYRDHGIKTLLAEITDLKTRPVDAQMRVHVE
jgi:hypothetical protein